MIQEKVDTFMALAPLMVPSLITTSNDEESEITEDYALLYFQFEERLPISIAVDTCAEGLELLQLYFGTSRAGAPTKHCCLFSQPSYNKQMYKINFASDSLGFVKGLAVTLYESSELLEQALENDLLAHSSGFVFESAMTTGEVLSHFCKIR